MTTTPDTDGPHPPLRHDSVTTACPVCRHRFTPVGRQRYCCNPCRATAYRRRRDAGKVPVVVPNRKPRGPITVYSCDGCGARAVGEQRCQDCHTFMRRVGLGGSCPYCNEPISVDELLGRDTT